MCDPEFGGTATRAPLTLAVRRRHYSWLDGGTMALRPASTQSVLSAATGWTRLARRAGR